MSANEWRDLPTMADVAAAKEAVLAEQIVIELEQLGLKEAA